MSARSARQLRRCWASSPGPEFDELPPQVLRQVGPALRGAQVGRRILRFEIAPTLKCPPRLRHRALQVRVEIEAAAFAVIVGHVIDRDDALVFRDGQICFVKSVTLAPTPAN